LTYCDNSVDAFIPELWAQEGLLQLENNMVMAGLVYRDFETTIANYGDTVNAQRPADFTARRKDVNDDITLQNAVATNVPVLLNHLVHNSFIIRDAERSKSFKDLVSTFIVPAARAMGQYVDAVLCGQVYQYMGNVVGNLGTALTKNSIVNLRSSANTLKQPTGERRVVLTSASEGDLLKIEDFTRADYVGDAGQALREAFLGRKFGFDFFMDQNTPAIATGNTYTDGEVNNSGGYAIGTTVLTVDGFAAAIDAGSFVTVEGDDVPRRVVSTVGGATPTEITLDTGLLRAVADNADIIVYTPGAVNLVAGYAAGWAKAITVDGFTVSPKVGQIVAFGNATTTQRYAIVEASTTSITLDRPLEAAIANNDVVCIGPKGNFNFEFHKNALALVCRPLALPMAGSGARGAVVNYNNLSMRYTLAYDAIKQGHIATFDLLMGVKPLDSNLGIILLG
jgi:hypothetical protein